MAARELLAFALGRRRLCSVRGHSMQPTLRPDDRVLVRRRPWQAVPLGALVVVELPSGSRLIKRLSSRGDATFAVSSDAPEQSLDSRQLGSFSPVQLVGQVTCAFDATGTLWIPQ